MTVFGKIGFKPQQGANPKQAGLSPSSHPSL